MKLVSIIGSHGYIGKYGGWDQLVKNLIEGSGKKIKWLIHNPVNTPIPNIIPNNCTIKVWFLKANGLSGLFLDFFAIFNDIFKTNTFLLLGMRSMPLIAFFKLLGFRKKRIVVNIGGIEWERPKFSFFGKKYLKFCFYLTKEFADSIIIDNDHYKIYFEEKYVSKLSSISYGGEISYKISEPNNDHKKKYPFLVSKFFLTISRSLEDNNIYEVCESFKNIDCKNLVVISNLSSSEYGKKIINDFSACKNIFLIDGLYEKDELDLIRRKCFAYIHTHTLCGSAPSLIEMIVCDSKIISIDVPQNRNTLNDNGLYFKNFNQLEELILKDDIQNIEDQELASNYSWKNIVESYEQQCFGGTKINL